MQLETIRSFNQKGCSLWGLGEALQKPRLGLLETWPVPAINRRSKGASGSTPSVPVGVQGPAGWAASLHTHTSTHSHPPHMLRTRTCIYRLTPSHAVMLA